MKKDSNKAPNKTQKNNSNKEKTDLQTTARQAICKHFATAAGCRHGSQCHFVHSAEGKAEGSLKPQNKKKGDAQGPGVCTYFATEAGCRHGSNCRFLHSAKTERGLKPQNKPQNEASTRPNTASKVELSPEINFFLKSILKKAKEKQLNQPYFVRQLDVELWKSAVEIIASRSTAKQFTEFVTPLLKIYLALAHTASTTPNINHVILLLIKQLENIQTMEQLELVKEVLVERLMKEHALAWIDQKEKITELEPSMKRFGRELSTQIAKLAQKFSKELSSFLKVAGELNENWEKYKQDVISRKSDSVFRTAKANHNDGKVSSSTTLSIAGWYQNPTIEWLVGGEWYDQVKLKRSYETTEEYITTIQQLWTQLSFYWGLSAFWPKCRCETTPQAGTAGANNPTSNKDNKKSRSLCNAPLLCPISSASNRHELTCSMTFKNRGRCNNTAAFMCANQRGHDAICWNCIRKKVQESLRGPSPDFRGTSTDVYDAIVRDVYHRQESIVLNLTQVLSRKPPEVAVNWKTSYRLQPACLVAVVVLHYQKADIPLSARLHWGEIIVKDPSKEDFHEYNRRARGELTVRLLSKNDSSLLAAEVEETFKPRSVVAVIDCRVFVPEVFSVLSTLSLPNFKRGIERLPFYETLLNPNRAVQQSDLAVVKIFDHSDIYSAVPRAVIDSRISGIQKLSSTGKMQLSNAICKIPQVKTLDRTQLQAFCQGLLQDCHCTLGPPGTGKSYVGVCLVLALYQVKKLLLNEGHSVGPIVALSYKNHALDEFLKDVKDSCLELQQKRGQLIRIGKPELEELLRFTEKSSIEESAAKQELDSRLKLLRQSKELLRSMLKMINEEINWDVVQLFHVLQIVSDSLTKSKRLAFREVEPEEAYDILEAIQEHEPSLLAMEMIAFIREVEHWRVPVPADQTRINILFYHWLAGAVPPPRCAHVTAMGQCLHCASDGSSFCVELHRCGFNLPSCSNEVISPASPYCSTHCCGVPECNQQKLAAAIPYCGLHLCPLCPTNPKEAGGKACKAHQCRMRGCAHVVISPFDFCIDHMCRKCLEAGNFHSEAGQVAANIDYCHSHLCKAKGCKDCKLDGFDYCQHHLCLVCGQEVIGGQQYCDVHRCQWEEGCDLAVILVNNKSTYFCAEHACRHCILRKEEEVYPSQACLKHPLCGQLDCYDVADAGLYCSYHTPKFADGKCNATKKKGGVCRGQALPGELFCKDHIKDHKATTAPLPPKPPVQLTAGRDYSEFPLIQPPVVAVVPPPPQQLHLYRCGHAHCEAMSVGDPDWKCGLHGIDLTLAWPTEPSILPNQKEVLEEVAAKEPREEKVSKRSLFSHLVKQDNAMTEKKETGDKYDSDDEFEEVDYPDGAILRDDTNGKVGVDEMEVAVDEEEEEEQENEEQKHFKQLFQDEDEKEEVGDDDSGEENFLDLLNPVDMTPEAWTQFLESLADHLKWTWTMSKSDREQSFGSLLSRLTSLMKQLILLAEKHVDAARRDKEEANASAFKQASVIGGTIVGAAKRLAALRGAEPFAIVVEEACEVMEPTLISVLAVESLQKLELIGDQRQLPAFIQNCWYNIEISNPSIKRSLFERMVETDGSNNSINPDCTLLDVQRRMRSSISALTKRHYADVVQIIDDKKTRTQKIGDRLPKGLLTDQQRHLRQSLWSSNGRLVPGLQSTIFFWNMRDNKESRPTAGLSACNENEALAVVALTKFLLLCGVPAPAITILTPYQGQKRTILSKLKAERLVSYHNPTQNVLLSTVDRYQGDENDIVILSLVRARPGNRFVSLLNRFIVATSRARLGFYVIGSVQAVVEGFQEAAVVGTCTANAVEKEPVISSRAYRGLDHWKQFILQLQTEHQQLRRQLDRRTKVDSDSDLDLLFGSEDDDQEEDRDRDNSTTNLDTYDDLYDGSRVSSLLPLCCPQHRDSCQTISSIPDQRVFPTPENWNTFCNKPCEYSLRCGHKCGLPCHLPIGLEHNSKCEERLQRPCDLHCYNPLYCHMVPIAAGQTLVEALSVYPCEIVVTRSYDNCDHPLSLPCEEWKRIHKGLLAMPKCEELVEDFIQPVCGHVIAQPKCWERQEYQRTSPKCREKVKRRRECGHAITEECCRIEEKLSRPCNCLVNAPRPRCGHPISLRCFEVSELTNLWNTHTPYDTLQVGEKRAVREEVREEETYGLAEKDFFTISVNCEVPVQFRRACGHVLKTAVACYRAYRMTASEGMESVPRCDDLVEARCKLCERAVFIPCHLRIAYERWDPFTAHPAAMPVREANDLMTMEQTKVELLAADLAERRLWQLLQSVCKHQNTINYIRSCKPRPHSLTLNCEQVLNLILSKKPLPACKVPVLKTLPCAHEKEVECQHYFDNVLCMRRPLEPYVFPDCGHSLQVSKCHLLQKMKAERATNCQRVVEVALPRCNHTITTICSQQHLAMSLAIEGSRCRDYVNDDKTQQLLVKEENVYCQPCDGSPTCETAVTFQRLCQHTIPNVACARAFEWTTGSEYPPPCRKKAQTIHPLCGHAFETECRVSSQLTTWTPWEERPRPTSEWLQTVTDVQELVKTDRLLQALPYRVRPFPVEDPSLLLCPQPLLVEFSDCHHIKSYPCSTVFERIRELQCEELEGELCRRCGQQRWFPCCDLRRKTRAEREQTCPTLVKRSCQVCAVNEVEVKCQSTVVHCRRLVKVRLPCQHEGQWRCGEEEDLRDFHDPRSGRNPRCVQCNIDLWNQVCDWNQVDADSLSQYCLAKLSSLLPTVDFRHQIVLPSLEKDLERHATARSNIIRQLIQSFREGKCASFPPPRWIEDQSIGGSATAAAAEVAERDLFDFLEDHYEVVFLVMDPKNQPDLNAVGMKRFAANKPTIYARGLAIQKLTKDALYALTGPEEAASSRVKILVGLAFRCQLLQDTPPFLPQEMLQEKKQGDANKFQHAAEQTKQQYLFKGYDGVAATRSPEKDITDFVFWLPGSAVAVGILEFELHTPCQTCGDAVPCDRAFGAICSKQHLVCWECFSSYITAASQPDRIHGFVDADGNLNCPEINCRMPYEMMEIVRTVPKQIGEQLIGLKLQLNVAKEAASIQKQEEQKWQAELKKVREMSELEQKVYFLRKKIVEEIFTPQCPRCHTAYLEFDGCFDVTCIKRECGAHFCGWCEQDCENDAHAHATRCQYNPRPGYVHGTMEDLKVVRKKIRSKRVRDLLAHEPESVKEKLREAMRKDFADIGLAMNF